MKEVIVVEVQSIGTMMPSPARSDGSDQLIALGQWPDKGVSASSTHPA